MIAIRGVSLSGLSSTYEDLRSRHTGLTDALSDEFLIVIQPKQDFRRPITRGHEITQSLPSAIDVPIPALQRVRNSIDDLLGFGLPGTYPYPPQNAPGDPEFSNRQRRGGSIVIEVD